MSLLTRRLPRWVEAGGRAWPIDPDFRLMVELESAVASPEGLLPETLGGLLGRFYPQGIPMDAAGAVDGMLWFYRCGKEEGAEGGAPGHTRLYDFEQDGEALYASFLQAFRIDLTTDSVHWWQFRQLMFGLPADTPFAQRLHYRTADSGFCRIVAAGCSDFCAGFRTEDSVLYLISITRFLSILIQISVTDLGGPRHAGGPLFCAPKFAPNCPQSAPKTCFAFGVKASPKRNKKPLKPLRFKGFRLVETTELEFNFSSDKVYQNISACAVVFAANGS